MQFFVNNIIFRLSHRLLYCVLIELDFEKKNARFINISSEVSQSRT